MPRTTARSRPAKHDVIDALLEDWGRERPELDVTGMAVVGRILHLGRLLEGQANDELRPYSVSHTELDVLATLRRSGKPYRLSPTVLRQSVLLTSGAMTACLNRLEARGLIKRSPVDDDRRSLTAYLTPRGLDLIDQAIAARFEQARNALAGLSSTECMRLAALLRKLRLQLG
jgi:DNA-binding MarR family transcriptional regulator